MNVVEQVKQFMEPESIAIIGISRQTGEGAFNIAENLLTYGYQGRIYPINPNATEILGVKAYPDITEAPEDIDLGVINLPRSPWRG
jgi:acyl-CoA synthetase (NDP forming)